MAFLSDSELLHLVCSEFSRFVVLLWPLCVISIAEDIPAEVWDIVVEAWPGFLAERLVYCRRRERLSNIEELAAVGAETNPAWEDPGLRAAWEECLALFPDKNSWRKYHSGKWWIFYNPRVRGDLYPENHRWL